MPKLNTYNSDNATFMRNLIAGVKEAEKQKANYKNGGSVIALIKTNTATKLGITTNKLTKILNGVYSNYDFSIKALKLYEKNLYASFQTGELKIKLQKKAC